MRDHISCYDSFTSASAQVCVVNEDEEQFEAPVPKKLRSQVDTFAWSSHCFFCCQPAGKSDVHAQTIGKNGVMESVLQVCVARADDWALQVKSRLNSINDLPAVDAVYHRSCSVSFRNFKAKKSLFNQIKFKSLLLLLLLIIIFLLFAASVKKLPLQL